MAPDGSRLYVASQYGHGNDPLFVIDTSTNRIVGRIPGLAVGNAVALSPDGSNAYVTRANYGWYDAVSRAPGGPVSVVDTSAERITKTLVVQRETSGIALTQDGKYAIVTNGIQLSVIDAQTNEVVANRRA